MFRRFGRRWNIVLPRRGSFWYAVSMHGGSTKASGGRPGPSARWAPAGTLALALLFGCAGPPPPPGRPADTVYRGLSEELPRLDPSVLAGRRIVIDPGHGGHFSGTEGQNGLQESTVNLGVALYLWGLLNESGAEVFLTRSAEKDFLADGDSSVASDLAARVERADSLEPDVFVSIHHNAEPLRDPSKNVVETYYKFGDPASRDLAFTVHRHLMRNLGIRDGEVRAGNYFVLRNTRATAILGEASYLTHPAVEQSLRLSEKQRLEAEAYYLGLLEHFSRGTPSLRRIAPRDTILTGIESLVFEATDDGGLGLDPGSALLEVNGEAVAPFVSPTGEAITYELPWDAPNGRYDISLGVRNLLGNSSPTHRSRLYLRHPAEGAAFEISPAGPAPPGGTVRVRARVLDRRGLTVADGTAVDIFASGASAPDSARVRGGVVEFPLVVSRDAKTSRIEIRVDGKSFTRTLEVRGDSRESFLQFALRDSLSGDPILAASVLQGDSLVASGSRTGVYFIPAAVFSDAVTIRAAGYRPLRVAPPLPADRADTLLLRPWFAGALRGRRFVVDPEGGFGPEAGRGRLGLSGAHVNLVVARYLEEYLEAAGAEVELSRRTETTLSARDVVDLTNRFRADRYIEIRHRSAPADTGRTARTAHFPGSRTGADMAADVQSSLAKVLGLPAAAPAETVTFPLQQTACPAIVVEAPSIGLVDEEVRLAEPWYQRLQAYGIFLGVLDHFGPPASRWIELHLEPDSLAGNWLVRLDGTWNLLSAPDGRAAFLTEVDSPGWELEIRRGTRYGRRWVPSAEVENGRVPVRVDQYPFQ